MLIRYLSLQVLAALSNASVSRLKKTWELLPTSSSESFNDLGQVMSSQSSFKLYRERLRASAPPSIPYIGVYLSDLVFIDEGNPDTLEQSDLELVNFDKHKQVAAVIQEIQKYQQNTYLGEEGEGGKRNEEIIEFLMQVRGVDDDLAYKTSLLTEPRARAGSTHAALSPSSSFLQRLRSQSPSGTM